MDKKLKIVIADDSTELGQNCAKALKSIPQKQKEYNYYNSVAIELNEILSTTGEE